MVAVVVVVLVVVEVVVGLLVKRGEGRAVQGGVSAKAKSISITCARRRGRMQRGKQALGHAVCGRNMKSSIVAERRHQSH